MLVRLMVSWIHPQVMVFLGKIKNPATDEMERNLEAARTLIDVLAELQTKTEGRLEADDQRHLQHVLTELRMNWVDESAKEPAAGEEGAKAPNGADPDNSAGTPSEAPPTPSE
ncbi:MAG: hypothetical protein FD129_2348 [bacterium]|nr:MAG: hypothetical protein FD129_2348 [bacterium]